MPRIDSGRLQLAARHRSELLALLRRHVPDAVVWAYGSRVDGRAHEGSDLDLALRNARDPSLPVVGTAALRDALQASALPMLVEAHDWSHLPVRFRESIERRHVELLGAQPDRVESRSG